MANYGENEKLSQAVMQYIRGYIERLNLFWDRTEQVCPVCGEYVERAEQIGECVYAFPCGCRIAQGKLHPNWKSSGAGEK